MSSGAAAAPPAPGDLRDDRLLTESRGATDRSRTPRGRATHSSYEALVVQALQLVRDQAKPLAAERWFGILWVLAASEGISSTEAPALIAQASRGDENCFGWVIDWVRQHHPERVPWMKSKDTQAQWKELLLAAYAAVLETWHLVTCGWAPHVTREVRALLQHPLWAATLKVLKTSEAAICQGLPTEADLLDAFAAGHLTSARLVSALEDVALATNVVLPEPDDRPVDVPKVEPAVQAQQQQDWARLLTHGLPAQTIVAFATPPQDDTRNPLLNFPDRYRNAALGYAWDPPSRWRMAGPLLDEMRIGSHPVRPHLVDFEREPGDPNASLNSIDHFAIRARIFAEPIVRWFPAGRPLRIPLEEMVQALAVWGVSPPYARFQDVGAWYGLDGGWSELDAARGNCRSDISYTAVPNPLFGSLYPPEHRPQGYQHLNDESIGNFMEAYASVVLLERNWAALRRCLASLMAQAACRERGAMALGAGETCRATLPPEARWPQVLYGTSWAPLLTFHLSPPPEMRLPRSSDIRLTLPEIRATRGHLYTMLVRAGIMSAAAADSWFLRLLKEGLRRPWTWFQMDPFRSIGSPAGDGLAAIFVAAIRQGKQDVANLTSRRVRHTPAMTVDPGDDWTLLRRAFAQVVEPVQCDGDCPLDVPCLLAAFAASERDRLKAAFEGGLGAGHDPQTLFVPCSRHARPPHALPAGAAGRSLGSWCPLVGPGSAHR